MDPEFQNEFKKLQDFYEKEIRSSYEDNHRNNYELDRMIENLSVYSTIGHDDYKSGIKDFKKIIDFFCELNKEQYKDKNIEFKCFFNIDNIDNIDNILKSQNQEVLIQQYHKLHKLVKDLIYSYLYFGICPSLIENSKKYGFYYNYFIWVNANDKDLVGYTKNVNDSIFDYIPNIGTINPYTTNLIKRGLIPKPQAPETLSITKDNFKLYIWSEKQLLDNFFNNTLKSILVNELPDYLRSLIQETIKNPNVFKNYINLIKPYINININKKIDRRAITMILDAFQKLYVTRQNLYKKIKNITEKDNKNRFKWQKLCSAKILNKELTLDNLKDLAVIDNLPGFETKTKRELCVDFAKKFENMAFNKKNTVPKCINTTSILLTPLEDIPPEFFFSYSHNNKIYCDDIRELNEHLNNAKTEPVYGTKLPQKKIDRIKHWYEYIKETANTLDDFEEEVIPMSISSQISAKLAQFGSKLNYPNSLDLFRNANKQQVEQFVIALLGEHIINPIEQRELAGFTDLNQYKLQLLEKLIIKIRNDSQQMNIPGQREPLSAIAINISNVYNEIFIDQGFD
jgi:hypothetical protein